MRNRRLFIVRTAMALALFGAGVVLRPAPACPSEDSCELDFRNGGWHVRLVDDRTGEGLPPRPLSGWSRVTR